MSGNSQKFIARNRAPRVQIEYDVELYGSEKKVQLPFVMGVMSDLSGKSKLAQPGIDERSFLEIDVDNFDDRMKAMQPRAAFSVPNTLTGEGNLEVDLTFERMDDFSPGAIAAKIEPLRALLEARSQLSDLMAYMDGKTGAETLIEKILADKGLLSALSGGAAAGTDVDAGLASLRALSADQAPEPDKTADVLNTLKAQEPETQPERDKTDDVLAGLAAAPVPDEDATDHPDALDALRRAAPPEPEPTDDQGAVLADLRAATPVADTEDTGQQDALATLADAAPEAPTEDTAVADVLDGLSGLDLPPEAEDNTDDLLADLAAAAPETPQTGDDTADVLENLSLTEVDAAVADTTDDLLADLAATAPEPEEVTDTAASVLDALSDLDLPQENPADRTDDLLADLAASVPETDQPADRSASVLEGLADLELPDDQEDNLDDLLADLAGTEPDAAPVPDDTAHALDSVAKPDIQDEPADTTDDLLADLAATEIPEETVDLTDALLSDLATSAPADPEAKEDLVDALRSLEDPEPADDDSQNVDDLLADLGTDAPDETPDQNPADIALGSLAAAEPVDALEIDLDDLLADMSAPLSDEPSPQTDGDPVPDSVPAPENAVDDLSELDDLLGDLDLGQDPGAESPEPDATTGVLGAQETTIQDDTHVPQDVDPVALDDGTERSEPPGDTSDLDDLLADLDDLESPAETTGQAEDQDDMLADLDLDEPADQATLSDAPEFAFGQLTSDRPDAEKLNRKRFRIAILGDFSGRAARGLLETGDALASRKPMLLDPDTVEDVIAGFATTLVLPLGKEHSGLEVKLGGLDDLHPDALYENLPIFAELAGLRGQLNAGATAENAARQLREWGEKYATPVAPPRTRSAGNAVPADRKLSDFQKLIGDTQAQLTQPSPLDDLIARIVGPHIRAVPDADTVAMQKAVDQALAAAMRLILHHPEFQSVESQWRSLDLIARSVEADDTLDVMLYDISAEEIAADLASANDLAQSGLVRLLTGAPLDEENGRGGYSALVGLYTFEETPPHADLLGRISRVAAHVDAPFFAGISPAFMETAKEDRPAIVASAWDTLRSLPEAGYLGIASPRFLLRRPYGAKSEPIYEFEFEEFTMSAGLGGMLWANPVVLVTILLAQSFRKNGPSMGLGSVMSLGDMPFHVVNDRYGDQVALPCTERNLTLDKVEKVMARGLMPVVSIKGRDEIRLASFQSLAGSEILGPWSGVEPPAPSVATPVPVAPDGEAEPGGDDLDSLLAEFSDEGGADTAPQEGDLDAELAALLEDL